MRLIMKHQILLMAAILAAFVSSCSENVAPDASNVDITMKATTQAGTLNSGARVAATEIEFTEAVVGVTKIEFESSADSADDDNSGSGNHSGRGGKSGSGGNDDSSDSLDSLEVEIQGNFIVDLIAGTSSPDFGISGIVPGAYDKLEVKMRPILDGGKTLRIVFNYSIDGSAPTVVEITTSQELEFEVESISALDISAATASNILILLDLDKLLASIDFSSGVKSPDGIIRINETSNTTLAAAIVSNLKSSCEAGEDDDRDDEFDDN
jgi:hypothetical protein